MLECSHIEIACVCVCLALCDMCVFQLDFEFLVHTLREKRVDDGNGDGDVDSDCSA